MQIVANWHSGLSGGNKKRASLAKRVQRVLPVKKVKRHNQQVPFEETLFLNSAPLNAQAAVDTQIIMTDFIQKNGSYHDKGQALAVCHAYGEALGRKVHHMDKGSFYEETA